MTSIAAFMTPPAMASDPQVVQIESAIAEAKTAILELKNRRNLLSPISKLPPETLCHIFKFCSLPSPITRDEARMQACPEDEWNWIVVSHVSQHWRLVALGCPSLWSRPNFEGNMMSKSPWVHEMIERRSKDASLTIIVNPSSRLHGVGAALTHIKRIEVLRLDTISDEEMQAVLAPLILLSSGSDFTGSLIPRLHTLSISIGDDRYDSHVPFHLPPSFLSSDGGAPNLQRLELTHCHLPWQSALYSNLTYLKVQSHGPLVSSSMDDFLRALEQMTELQELVLGGAILNLYPSPSSAYRNLVQSLLRPIALPRLRTLRVCGKIDECAPLLAHIRIPLTTLVHLQVECTGVPAKDSDVLHTIENFCRRLPLVQEQTNDHAVLTSGNATPGRIKSMLAQTSMNGSGVLIEASYNSGPMHSFSPNFNSYPCPSIPPSASQKPNLTLLVIWPSQGVSYSGFCRNTKTKLDNQCRALSRVCSVLPLDEMTDLHVNFPLKLQERDGRHGRSDVRIHPSDLRVRPRQTDTEIGISESPMHTLACMFGALPNITSLTAEGHSASGFVDVLGGSTSTFTGFATSLSFPSLRSLSLLEVDFDRFIWQNGAQIDPASPDPSDISVMITPLSDALRHRIEHCAPLHSLSLVGCAFVCPPSIEKLEDVIGWRAKEVLEWDGLEIVYADDDTPESDDEDDSDELDSDELDFVMSIRDVESTDLFIESQYVVDAIWGDD